MFGSSLTVGNVPNFEYQWIDEVEKLERYQPGGYHPIHIGDELADRYRVVHKLGYGTYSTIWLARDRHREVYVAIKINTANAPSCETGILHALADSRSDHPGRAMIPSILDQFELQGPNGCHRCYVTSPARSSVTAAKSCYLFTIETARALVSQLILAVAYTHARGFAHGDIHLGNALLRLPASFDQISTEEIYKEFGGPRTEMLVRLDGKPLPPNVPSYGVVPVWLGKQANLISLREAHLLLSDFGEAFTPETQRRSCAESHAPLPVSPPEVLFDPQGKLSFPSDIWTLACAIWSIFGMRSLFDGTLATHHDIASQQIDTLGLSSFPSEWWNTWQERHEYFDNDGQPKGRRSVFPPLERSFEEEIQVVRREEGMQEFDEDEKMAIIGMLRSMLVYRPEKRATADSVTRSEWMTNWGLPQLKKAQNLRSGSY
ncbi:hypothetical protein FQN54_008303 [Arachnomyces sp. PD_36]|nr:hypothetical protein FQN54_008303 [Arachnomyces sp. PD_36]